MRKTERYIYLLATLFIAFYRSFWCCWQMLDNKNRRPSDQPQDDSFSTPGQQLGRKSNSPTVSTTVLVPDYNVPHPYFIDDILAYLKDDVNRLPFVNSRMDLFEFCFHVQHILRRRGYTRFLLDPLPSNATPAQRGFSCLCQIVLRSRFTNSFWRSRTWADETYEFLQQLKGLMPELEHTVDVPHHYPERGKTESTIDYITRFELWQARYFPTSSREALRYCAMAIWKSHARLYEVPPGLAERFFSAETSFTSFDQIYEWFMLKDGVFDKLEPRSVQLRQQQRKGKRKTRGNGSHRRNYGKVSKRA